MERPTLGALSGALMYLASIEIQRGELYVKYRLIISSAIGHDEIKANSDPVVGSGNGSLSGFRFHGPRATRSRSGRTRERIGFDSRISPAKDLLPGN